MANDISGFGLKVTLFASNSFPQTLPITQFADDADPIEIDNLTIADSAIGLNGDALYWTKPNLTKITLNVVPGSEDDALLGVLLENNRGGAGKVSAGDTINLTVNYPDGSFKIYNNGRILSGVPGKSVASSARMKSKPYQFAFEGQVGGG